MQYGHPTPSGIIVKQGMVDKQTSRVWTMNWLEDSLTLSLALISAPLSSRAITVSVWPFIDER